MFVSKWKWKLRGMVSLNQEKLRLLLFLHHITSLLFVSECDGAVQPRPEEPGHPGEELREVGHRYNTTFAFAQDKKGREEDVLPVHIRHIIEGYWVAPSNMMLCVCLHAQGWPLLERPISTRSQRSERTPSSPQSPESSVSFMPAWWRRLCWWCRKHDMTTAEVTFCTKHVFCARIPNTTGNQLCKHLEKTLIEASWHSHYTNSLLWAVYLSPLFKCFLSSGTTARLSSSLCRLFFHPACDSSPVIVLALKCGAQQLCLWILILCFYNSPSWFF